MYKCNILADSISPQKHRIATYKVTYPRIIHAEMCRHRILGRNSASSRAIPFKKMVKMVKENPFIPIAWQKDHPGMQGTEYLSKTDTFNLNSFIVVLMNTLSNFEEDSKEYNVLKNEINEKIILIESLLQDYKHFTKTLDDWWLLARDKAVEAASIFHVFRTTKQLCNRLLEPFLWHTEIITGTEYDNFFSLRCPKYYFEPENIYFESKYDFGVKYHECFNTYEFKDWDFTKWQSINISQAEIHIQAIAEMMWDAYNENKPTQLKAGEWHIPFGDNIDEHYLFHNLKLGDPLKWGIDSFRTKLNDTKVKVATARCARISYETLGDNPKINYEADIKLHDMLLESKHMSPFEHCARVMSYEEYRDFYRGSLQELSSLDTEERGWCRNFKGFIQYRHLIEQ